MSILIYFATIFWSLFPNLIHVFQGGDDFINKVNETNLIVNGDFSNGTTGWSGFNANISVVNDIMRVNPNVVVGRLRQSLNTTLGTEYFYSIKYKQNSVGTTNTRIRFDNDDLVFFTNDTNTNQRSNIFNGVDASVMDLIYYGNGDGDYIDIFYLSILDISKMKLKGVKNDNGVPFTLLSVEQIKTQLDYWINEYGSLDFVITKDNTSDQWFNTGFVEKTAERDFIDYLGYFVWLLTPPIMLFATLNLIRRLL